MATQLALEDDANYEVEHVYGSVGRAFPVIITPSTILGHHGASVKAPQDVEYAVYDQEDGTVVVCLRFLRAR